VGRPLRVRRCVSSGASFSGNGGAPSLFAGLEAVAGEAILQFAMGGVGGRVFRPSGDVAGTAVTCPGHADRYSLKSGRCVSALGSAARLRRWRAWLDDSNVWLGEEMI